MSCAVVYWHFYTIYTALIKVSHLANWDGLIPISPNIADMSLLRPSSWASERHRVYTFFIYFYTTQNSECKTPGPNTWCSPASKARWECKAFSEGDQQWLPGGVDNGADYAQSPPKGCCTATDCKASRVHGSHGLIGDHWKMSVYGVMKSTEAIAWLDDDGEGIAPASDASCLQHEKSKTWYIQTT